MEANEGRVALRYLGLGAGIQSSAIVEMMVLGILPQVDLAVFSDLEDEPSYVYRQLSYLEGRLQQINVPLVRLHPGSIVEKLLSDTVYMSIPAYAHRDGKRAQLRRQCTEFLKVRVIQGYIKSLLAERGLTRPRRMKTMTAQVVKQGVLVECWLGLTTDEAHRLKPNRKPWIVNRWPLVDLGLTRTQCAIWLKLRGLPVPQKSSCRICPFHDARYWRMLAAEHPNDFASARRVENELLAHRGRFASGIEGAITLHYTGMPLGELVTKGLEEKPALLDVCDAGYCWT